MKEVSTSILSNEDKYKNIEKLNNSNTDYIHLDVMDNTFTTSEFISNELENVIEKCQKKIDIHLMVCDVLKYTKMCKSSKVSYLTFPLEIGNTSFLINEVKKQGFKVGISINPETVVEDLLPYLKDIDLVLVMGVNPGKSGQTFIPETTSKIDFLKEYRKQNNLNYKISIDGGICDSVLSLVNNTDIIVSASYILSNLNNIDKIKTA